MANKIFDYLGLIVEDQAVTTTASTTGANIAGLNVGSKSYVAVVNYGTLAGTFDGSNNYTIALEVSDAVGGTYAQVGRTLTVLEAGQSQIGFTSEELEEVTSGAGYFRLTVTKVGTTATGVTVSAFVSVI